MTEAALAGAILIVDEKPEAVYQLATLLTAQGYSVRIARDATEAITVARQRKPILCIADLQAPVVKHGLLRDWEADESLRDVPIMVYSATEPNADPGQFSVQIGTETSMASLTQPDALIAAVKRVLDRLEHPASDEAEAKDGMKLRQYSAEMVHSLEENSVALESSNRLLSEQIVARQAMLAMRDAIIDALPAQVALIDQEGFIVAINSSWAAALKTQGHQVREMKVGGNYLQACLNAEVTIPGVGREMLAGVKDVLAGKLPAFELEYAYPAVVGTAPLWFRAIMTAIAYDGRVGAVITRIDVTDRRRIEEDRRETAVSLSLAVEAAAIGIWEMRDDQTLIWNRVMYALYGIDEHVTPTVDLWLSMMNEDERGDLDAALAGLKSADDPEAFRFEIKRPDGNVRQLMGVAKRLPGLEGGRDKLIGTNMDITERVQQEGALHAVNARMQALVKGAPLGILVQRDLKPLMANDALAHMLGLPDRHAVEALPDFGAFFDLDQRLETVAAWNALISGEAPASDVVPMRGMRADGQPLEIEVRSFCIDWDGGPAICAMVTDVTAQRAVQAQLHQAQRLEAVGQLTGGVAHDFNNLLTVILGNAELLEEELAENPFQQRLSGMIVRAAERGAELARHLLTFSRRQPLQPDTVDISAMLVGLEDFLTRAVGPTVELEIEAAPGLWSVLVDLAQLENALLNLAVNARDAMPDGGRLVIATRNVSAQDRHFDRPADLASGDHVMISVKDAGIGMDEKTRLRAFEPFFTTKDVGKGTGLGLPMVYGFVKQSSGAVRVHSALGQGTSVELWLPRDKRASKIKTSTAPITRLGGDEHVLVAEDDPMVRAQVVAQLQALGYRVTSADNGVAALALLQQAHHFDLLLTDIVMSGGMSGHDLAAAALELWPGLPVLLTSGFADRAARPTRSDLDKLPMLNKPYHREELAQKVRAAIDAG